MRLFRARRERLEAEPRPKPAPRSQPDPATPGPEGRDDRGVVSVSRTLVKSEPELADLLAGETRLDAPGLEVTLSEKGFGTRVAITAGPPADLSEAQLEQLLDDLAEPHRRPFGAG